MTIVIDARIINSSTGRYVERLLEYLQDIDRKNTYVVLVPEKDRNYWKPKAKNFSILTVPYKNYGLGEQIGFARFLYQLKPDLVHFCMPQQPLFYFRPHVTTVHDLTLLKTYNSDKNWWVYHFKQLVGRVVFYTIARTSRHIMTPSEFTKNEYVTFARISPSKVTVTYEAADLPRVKPKQRQLPFQDFILYVGQQSDYKNIRRLIQAHQQLLEKHPQLGLVLVGAKNDMTRRNIDWVRTHDYKNIHFTGFVSNEELVWLYQNCQAYVFPSLMEGFGLPGLEAMACGAPVASSDATCLPEVYGDAAHYFDPYNTDDMARVINDILTDTALRTGLIARGQVQAKKYSWRTMAEQTHDVYMQALQSES